jgi:hypothetical protein
VKVCFLRNPKALYGNGRNLSPVETRIRGRGGPVRQLPPGRQIINLPTAPTCLGQAPVAISCTRHDYIRPCSHEPFPDVSIPLTTAVCHKVACVCVPNVSSNMPTHHCQGHHRIAACRTSHSLVATAVLPFVFAVDLPLRHCIIFVATSGCRNTKLGTVRHPFRYIYHILEARTAQLVQ